MSSAPRWTSPIAVAVAVATAAVLATGARAADAGRTPFGWARATETLPERGVELETWIFEKNGVEADDGAGDAGADLPDETSVWWTTVVGITDQIEIAIPIEIRHLQAGASGGDTLLYAFGAEGRWRLVPADPVEAGPLAPAIRVGVHRLVNLRKRIRSEAGVALGIDLGARVHAGVDLGASWIAGDDDGDSETELRPAAGVSVQIIDQLRAGAEAYAEIVVDGPDRKWVAAGPNLAWTHGRFWLSGSMLIGIIDINAAPRINWGVAF